MKDIIYNDLKSLKDEAKSYIANSHTTAINNIVGIVDKFLKKYNQKENLGELINGFIAQDLERTLLDIPSSKAIKNSFFPLWTSEKMLSKDRVKDILLNYFSLTFLTRKGVSFTFLASSGIIDKEYEVAQNLLEETGEGNSDRAHIKLLLDYINGMLKLLGEKPMSMREALRYTTRMSTRLAREEEQNLYTGAFVDGVGLKQKPLTLEGVPECAISGVVGVSAAHEGKAPFMLAKLFEGSIKYMKNATSQDIHIMRQYFDAHLGESIVDRMLRGESYEQIVGDYEHKTTEELRKDGHIELAHARGAHEGMLETLDVATNIKDRLVNYLTGNAGLEMFLDSHGKFWDGLTPEKEIVGDHTAKYTATRTTNGDRGRIT